MRQLNGVYTQAFNRHHKRRGHLFQGRFKAILVERDSYLLELSRYVVLNPVRARMVRSAKDWKWSSYRATLGGVEPPEFLTVEWVLSQFGPTRSQAQRAYRRFVSAGRGIPIWNNLRGQIYLGSDEFIVTLPQIERGLKEIPRVQRLADRPSLEEIFCGKVDPESISQAYRQHGYTMKE